MFTAINVAVFLFCALTHERKQAFKELVGFDELELADYIGSHALCIAQLLNEHTGPFHGVVQYELLPQIADHLVNPEIGILTTENSKLLFSTQFEVWLSLQNK